MSGFAHLETPTGSLPVTESLAQQIFSLPMYPSLSGDRQEQIIEILLDELRRN
jgi:dTDP-3-amino-2,3,6-trideoxy-4-keto-D-glucose/dTDP-3-amino-3,4,6-trideoxy-alpha-D-glucose/dTDP-2,6-dideoxy-D-kanosamine transaminase